MPFSEFQIYLLRLHPIEFKNPSIPPFEPAVFFVFLFLQSSLLSFYLSVESSSVAAAFEILSVNKHWPR